MEKIDAKTEEIINVGVGQWFILCTVMLSQCYTPSKEKRRFLYFNHLSKEFLEEMIPHLKALI